MSITRDNEGKDQILSQNGITLLINSEIDYLQSTLGTTADQSLILLMKFEWNTKTLLEEFNTSPGTVPFLMEHGVLPGSITETIESKECSVCCSDGALVSLSCGHLACEDCWKAYLSRKIEDGHYLIECMNSDCTLVLGKEDIEKLDYDLDARYQSLVVNDYVKNTSGITKCPGASCELYFRFGSDRTKDAICFCSTQFCSSCGSTPHFPATCQQWKLWQKKCELPPSEDRNDSETRNWILHNTKDCPKCMRTIERKGGCAHVKCPNRECRHEFCWRCLGNWKTHGHVFCDSAQLQAEKDRLGALANAPHFISHYQRFERSSEKLNSEQIIHQASKESKSPFIRKTTKMLLDTREILTNSIVSAFYQKYGLNLMELEEQQSITEDALNKLEKLLNDLLETPDSVQLKHAVLEHFIHVEKLRELIFQLCTSGEEDLTGLSHGESVHWRHNIEVINDELWQGAMAAVAGFVIRQLLDYFFPDFEIPLPTFAVPNWRGKMD